MSNDDKPTPAKANKSNNPDGGNILSLIAGGMKANDEGQRDAAKSCQMLAAAVLLQHREDVEGGMKPPELDAIYRGSRKSATEYATRMLDIGAITYPKLEKGQERTDAIATAQRKYRSRHALMVKAVIFASHLNKAGVKATDLHPKLNLFQVPGVLLLGENDTATGKLFEYIQESAKILLDGRSYYTNHGSAIRAIEASMSQVIRAMRSVDPSLPGRLSAGGPRTESALCEPAGMGDFTKLAVELSAIIMTAENDESQENVSWLEIDPKVRNALENIRIFIEEAKVRQIKAARNNDVNEKDAA